MPPTVSLIGTIILGVALWLTTPCEFVYANPWLIRQCDLGRDPLASPGPSSLGLQSCLRGGVGIEATTYAETRRLGNWIPYGGFAASVFTGPYVSAHGLWRWRDVYALNYGETRSKARFVDYAVIQIGNPVLNRFRATFGRMRIPFGLDLSQAPQYYQDLENRLFWRSPLLGGYLTFDDMRRSRFDVGIASNDLSQLRAERLSQKRDDIAMSLRGILDVSALEGTRIIASLYSANTGERRYGLALSNTNRKGDQTNFEFVRRQVFASGQLAPFEQLLRVSYTGVWQKPGPWIIQFDDERLRFRRIVFSLNRPILFPHLLAKFAVGFTRKIDETKQSLWSFSIAMETAL
ncbi:MAG: hypothetical protein FJ146_04200 [Deltaproteobacteria bacterium]|nr:hypothetical protein [Deltaproteobacteria bacterium]